MFKLNAIQATPGSKQSTKRLGRGNGSGKGTFSGKGCKGQNARAGGGVRPGFEGGQTPLFRRMPKKRGFSNHMFKQAFNVVTLDTLEKAAKNGASMIDVTLLLKDRLVSIKGAPLKILGSGTITAKITVKASKFTAGAKAAIEKAGGKIEEIK